MADKKPIKKLKKAKAAVTDVVAEKAAELNPLTPRQPEAPVVPSSVPKITDETIAEHREDVLSGARKYIYPLAHSKHRIIVITTTILAITLLAFTTYCTLAMYKLYRYNAFLYRVTQVVPFPIARENGHFIEYENYLFEMRRYIHYYETQAQRDLNGADKQQLLDYRKVALDKVINDAYVRDLAKQNDVSVSNRDISDLMVTVRNQNRSGASDKEFNTVLKTYYGWSLSDFKRSLKQSVLSDRVVAKLDTQTNARAEAVRAKAKAGANFEKLAKRFSDDKRSAANGGDFGFPITKSNPNVAPQLVDTLFNLKPGKVSGVILASPVLPGGLPTLEIVKVLKSDGKTVSAQHISFTLKDINDYVNQLKQKNPPKLYVHF